MKINHLTFTTFLILIFFTTGFAQVPNYVPTNGLVGWWPFNGNANDYSGNGNNGVIDGPTLTTDRFGVANNAYEFRVSGAAGWGSPQQSIVVSTPTIPNVNSFTMSSWVNIEPKPSPYNDRPQTIMGRWDGNGNAVFRYQVSNTSSYYQGQEFLPSDLPLFVSCQTINFNLWYHVVITYDGTTFKQFLNGTLTNQYPVNTQIPYSNTDLTFGKLHMSNGHWLYFHGKMDEVGYWDRALTDQEISNLYFGCQDSLTSEPSNQSVSLGNSVNFTTSFSDPNSTFQWQTNLGLGFQDVVDAGQYQGGTNDTLTISNVNLGNDNQQFRCIVSSNLCSDTTMIATLSVNNNTGFDDSKNAIQIVISPNPTHKEITITLKNLEIGSGYVLEFKNQLGQSLFKHLLKAKETTIPLRDNIETGIYFVNIKDPAENIIDIKRIIVQ